MSTSQNNQNGGNGDYSAFNALTNLFTTTNPILAHPRGPRSAIGVGPNIRIPQQRDFGTASVVPGPMGVVVSPKSGQPAIPMPTVPSMTLNVGPTGQVTDQRSLGVPEGQKNYHVDYKLGYGLNSPFHSPKIIDDNDLSKTPVASPVPLFPNLGFGTRPPLVRGHPVGRGPLPPPPIGIPSMPSMGMPSLGFNNGMRVVSPVPVLPRPGFPALSMGFGIPRVKLADNYVRVVVNYGPFLEVVEGTPEEIASRLEGRIPGIRERLNLKKKDEGIPVDPENILEDVRASGVSWVKEGDMLVARDSSAAARAVAGVALGDPAPASVPAPVEQLSLTEVGERIRYLQRLKDRISRDIGAVTQGNAEKRRTVLEDVRSLLNALKKINSQSPRSLQIEKINIKARVLEFIQRLGDPALDNEFLQAGGAAKEKKFRSANVILVTNHVPVLSHSKDPVASFVVFKKSYPGDGTYVVSPYHKVDVSGELSENALLRSAVKSIEIASSGYIKLDVDNVNVLKAFDNMVEKGIYNRTYVIYVDKVDVNDHNRKYNEGRSATSSNPMSFSDMRLVPINQIRDNENYGRAVPVIDRISAPMQFRLSLNAESHNQLKGIVKDFNDKKGILMEVAKQPRPTVNTVNGVLVIK